MLSQALKEQRIRKGKLSRFPLSSEIIGLICKTFVSFSHSVQWLLNSIHGWTVPLSMHFQYAWNMLIFFIGEWPNQGHCRFDITLVAGNKRLPVIAEGHRIASAFPLCCWVWSRPFHRGAWSLRKRTFSDTDLECLRAAAGRAPSRVYSCWYLKSSQI